MITFDTGDIRFPWEEYSRKNKRKSSAAKLKLEEGGQSLNDGLNNEGLARSCSLPSS
jgi:hypothetical protein